MIEGHINWKNSTQDFKTSGTIICTGTFVSAPRFIVGGDADTYIELRQADSMTFTAGGVEFARLDETLFTDIMTFNSGSVDIDFTFNGDTVADLLKVDAGTDTVLFNTDIVLPKTSGKGIKIDTAAPTFGWRDLLGTSFARNTGASKPTLTTYRDTLVEFQFAAGDEAFFSYHIPHDYVPGTDVHLHVHWSHTGTLVTGGTVTFEYEISYSKGHNQAAFPASVGTTFNGTASTTQYQHIITEVQISASTPDANQIDTDNLEPDGVILARLDLNANNITVSGGGVPDPFIHFVDIHYQSTNMATKQKAPDFYT